MKEYDHLIINTLAATTNDENHRTLNTKSVYSANVPHHGMVCQCLRAVWNMICVLHTCIYVVNFEFILFFFSFDLHWRGSLKRQNTNIGISKVFILNIYLLYVYTRLQYSHEMCT